MAYNKTTLLSIIFEMFPGLTTTYNPGIVHYIFDHIDMNAYICET